MIELKILSNPVPKARPRFSKYGTYDLQGAEKHDYELQLALQYLDEPLTGPLIVTLAFYIQRPKYHFTKVSKRLTKSAPKYHIVTPDTSNYIKFVEDCMSGIVYKDDSQIIEVTGRKRYATDFIGTEINIIKGE